MSLYQKISLKESLKFLKNEKYIVIYWAGFYGKIYDRILKANDVNAFCYAVNELSDLRMYNGLPVFHISELPVPTEKCTLILALDPYKVDREAAVLSDNKFKKIILSDEASIIDYCNNYYLNVFMDNKIDISKPVIDLGFMKITNPVFQNYMYKKSFALQAKDLILPLFSDYSLLTEGPYEYDKIYLEKNDVVIDFGANIGLFSAYAASKGCKVLAFEPSEETVGLLKLNKELYKNNIEIYTLAVSDKNGTSPFYVYDNDCGANSCIFNYSVSEKTTSTVNTITLDDFVLKNSIERIDFIKADIEGSEIAMLKGAKKTLQLLSPKISICAYHNENDAENAAKIIKDYNPRYNVFCKWEKLFAFCDR